MGDITLTFAGGRTGLTEEALDRRVQDAAPLLAERCAGQSLGGRDVHGFDPAVGNGAV